MRDFHLPGRSAVFATNGMAATSHPIGALTAVETLKSGGNAMDAAIAGALVLGLCEPQMTGIGGDLFVLFSVPGEAKARAMNASGRAPAALDSEALRDAGHERIPNSGAIPVTIPGAVDGFCRLSQDWGRLGIDRLLAPAIHYAETGVPIAPRVAFDWQGAADRLIGTAQAYYLVDGTAPPVGTPYRHPAQAGALRRIAEQGRAGFYEGEVAEDMVTTLRAQGGVHTLEDFASNTPDYSVPVSGTYGDFELLEHPPNSHGAAAILLLNILKEFDIASMDPLGPERAHIEAEAAKLAYDARNRFIADPAYSLRTDELLSTNLARKLAGLIDPGRAMTDATRLSEQVHRDTIYITVVDADGMAVSMIYSIFSTFGSGLASERFGILFHDRGAGFNLTPGHPNEAGGGKRPMHTIIPGMLRQNGRTVMPFGVMGGPYQPNGHARFVSNLADFGMHPQAAIDAPRSFPWEGKLRVERGYAPAVHEALARKGHDVTVPDGPIGGAQVIRIHDNGVLEGASDPRKDGCALGY